MRTEEVSRWMRSCSKPMTMAQAGSSMRMGKDHAPLRITFLTMAYTWRRYSVTRRTSGHSMSFLPRSSHDISSTPVSMISSM